MNSALVKPSGQPFKRLKSNFFAVLFIILLSPAISGCDVLWDAAIDCIDNDKPVLSPGVLPNPILNQVYEGRVHVGIRNEPYDDRFNYRFRLSGSFPPGMQTEAVKRDFFISGTPTELGDYTFTVQVTVEDEYFGDDSTSGLCSTIDRQTYNWTIQPM